MKPCLKFDDFQAIQDKMGLTNEFCARYSIFDHVIDSLNWNQSDQSEHYYAECEKQCFCMQSEIHFMTDCYMRSKNKAQIPLKKIDWMFNFSV